MKNLRLEDLPLASEKILEKLDRIEKEVTSLKEYLEPKEPFELLTRKETADFLRISITTLHHWTKKGIIIGYGMGNRVYYKKSEIEKKITKIN